MKCDFVMINSHRCDEETGSDSTRCEAHDPRRASHPVQDTDAFHTKIAKGIVRRMISIRLMDSGSECLKRADVLFERAEELNGDTRLVQLERASQIAEVALWRGEMSADEVLRANRYVATFVTLQHPGKFVVNHGGMCKLRVVIHI